MSIPTAPSPLTISAVRRLARRRGYLVRKKRGKDLYFLIDKSNGQSVLADNHCVDPDDCYFTKYSLIEFLRETPLS